MGLKSDCGLSVERWRIQSEPEGCSAHTHHINVNNIIFRYEPLYKQTALISCHLKVIRGQMYLRNHLYKALTHLSQMPILSPGKRKCFISISLFCSCRRGHEDHIYGQAW